MGSLRSLPDSTTSPSRAAALNHAPPASGAACCLHPLLCSCQPYSTILCPTQLLSNRQVYLLPNCTLELGFVAWVAENALDCAIINTKGRTVTLYRCVVPQHCTG